MSRVPEITVITVFHIISLCLIYLTVVGNGSHQFCQFRNRGCNAHVKTVVLIVQSLLRMRLSLISSYLFLFRTIFSSSWISWAVVIDQDESGVELFTVSSVAPLSMSRPEKCDFFWTFANELVPRVMVLLVGNHVDLPNRETCHVSPIHSLCRFRCQGPLLINSWFPALPSSFLKFPSSSTLVLNPRLEVPCVHSFPSS